MKKKLNADVIQNELSGGSAFFPNYQKADSPAPAETQKVKVQVTEEPWENRFDGLPNINQSTEQSTSKPTSQSTSKSTNQSSHPQLRRYTSQSVNQSDNKIVDRPKAFYITERLDHRLDEAVRYLQNEHGIKKVDRSVLINALLDNDKQWTDEALDKLVDRVISQLTSRLMG